MIIFFVIRKYYLYIKILIYFLNVNLYYYVVIFIFIYIKISLNDLFFQKESLEKKVIEVIFLDYLNKYIDNNILKYF